MSAPRPPGKVIVLNGTSSAGKTSIAAELQRSSPELQLLHVQLDAFRAMEPPGYWAAEYRDQAHLRVEALCRAVHATAAQYALCGQRVLLDHVLSPTACAFLLQDLAGCEVLLVKVVCTLEELERREAQRSDRKVGLARSQLESVHAACSYDFELNSTSETPARLAHRLKQWLQGEPLPSAFQRMQLTNAA